MARIRRAYLATVQLGACALPACRGRASEGISSLGLPCRCIRPMNEPVFKGELASTNGNLAVLPAGLSSALAQYDHVAACQMCSAYAAASADLADEWTIVAATLSHHDSGHLHDALLVASQHFGACLR